MRFFLIYKKKWKLEEGSWKLFMLSNQYKLL